MHRTFISPLPPAFSFLVSDFPTFLFFVTFSDSFLIFPFLAKSSTCLPYIFRRGEEGRGNLKPWVIIFTTYVLTFPLRRCSLYLDLRNLADLSLRLVHPRGLNRYFPLRSRSWKNNAGAICHARLLLTQLTRRRREDFWKLNRRYKFFRS